MSTRRASALASGCVALGTAALLMADCKSEGGAGGCPVVADCGGDPTGEWQVEPDLTCNFPVVGRPAQNYAAAAPNLFAPETGATPPAVTSGFWCWDLTFDKDGKLIYPTVPQANPDHITSGKVTFGPGPDFPGIPHDTYIYSLTAESTTPFHIARSCLGVNGANLGPGNTPTTCAVLAMKMNDSIPASNITYMNAMGTPPFSCHEAGDGCDCTFDYIETNTNAVGDQGTWVKDGNVIHHYSMAGQGNLNETSPSRRTYRDATFCVNGNTLTLTGTDGMAIANKVGARSLTLTRVLPTDAGTGADAPSAEDATGAGGAGGAGGSGGAGGTAGAEADAGGDGAPSDASAE